MYIKQQCITQDAITIEGVVIMKKNIIISMLVLMLAAAAAGCNKNNDSNSALVEGTTATQTTEGVASSEGSSSTAGTSSEGSTSNGSGSSGTNNGESVEQNTASEFGDNADENVDMDKIEGTEAKTDKSGTRGDGKMTNCKVEIDEVKIAPVDDVYMVVIQFDFKNTSNSELNFGGEVYVDAYQDGMELTPTVVLESIEGYSPDTTMQKVAPGDSIKVQRAFTTSDPSTPVEIYVRDAADDSGQTYLAQVFRVE